MSMSRGRLAMIELLRKLCREHGPGCVVIGDWARWARDGGSMPAAGEIVVKPDVLGCLRDEYVIVPDGAVRRFGKEEGVELVLYLHSLPESEFVSGLNVPVTENGPGHPPGPLWLKHRSATGVV